MFSDPCIDCGVDRLQSHKCFVGRHPRCRSCAKKNLSDEGHQNLRNAGLKVWSDPVKSKRIVDGNLTARAERGEKQKKWKRSDRSQWSLNVRSRDGYKCALCLTVGRGRQMHAHHIFIASQFPEPEDALSLLNGITLCQPCHWSIHFPNGAK